MRVGILKNWGWPDLNRQVPGTSGIWDGIEFYIDRPDLEYDYVVVLNTVDAPADVRCTPNKIWKIMQEPPEAQYMKLHQAGAPYTRVYTNDETLTGQRFYHHHGSLPWSIDKDYDELKALTPPEKTKNLSWITSNKTKLAGHQKRMAFLEQLQNSNLDFDLYGKGLCPIDDKYDALGPYRYSIAVENHVNDYYWTEKITDCLLSWTMPLYHGCRRITDYFPEEAFIKIDIGDDHVLEHIQETLKSDWAEQNHEAIRHARELVLERYNLFAFIANEIAADTERPLPRKRVRLPAELRPSALKRGVSRIRKMFRNAA